MEVKVKLKNLRISPRKVRLVANLVKGLEVDQAKIQLGFLNKKSSGHLLSLLNSAVANAQNNFKLNEDNLYISKITVDSGPVLKRWMPRAMGRASEIKKRTSNVTMILEEKHENIQNKAAISRSVESNIDSKSQALDSKQIINPK